jgi:hypothetical protein
MRKAICSTLLILLASALVHAQVSEEANVMEVINRLFTGMHNADSTMIRSVFGDKVTLATVVQNKEGKHVLKVEDFNDFIKSIGKPSPEPLTEEIWNLKVQIDGAFAQAWCDYGFYVGNNFSHCGVDAFQLIKTQEGWKIFNLADTRRRDGCNVPEEIKKKHK